MFIITGGGSGIGRSLARALAQDNKKVLIIGRVESKLRETAMNLPNIEILVADLASSTGRNDIAEYCADKNITGLINNAGVLGPIVPIMSLEEQEFTYTMQTNIYAPLFLTQKILKTHKNIRVLNIGSAAAYFAIEGFSAYCISKAALHMLTLSLQKECPTSAFAYITPGIVDTAMQVIARSAQHLEPEQRTLYNDLHQNKKLVAPEAVAQFLMWLLFKVDAKRLQGQGWDIYDESHHREWLKAPHMIYQLEER